VFASLDGLKGELAAAEAQILPAMLAGRAREEETAEETAEEE
jgi:hypothetical protein